MKFRPLHDRVVVKRVEEEGKTKGGIIIPDTAKEKPMEGEIIAVGPGARDEKGTLVPLDVKKGEKVFAQRIVDAIDERGLLNRAITWLRQGKSDLRFEFHLREVLKGHRIDDISKQAIRDAVEPFLSAAKKAERGTFVLVRTSNPGSGLFQDLVCDGKPLYRHVADEVVKWNESTLG